MTVIKKLRRNSKIPLLRPFILAPNGALVPILLGSLGFIGCNDPGNLANLTTSNTTPSTTSSGTSSTPDPVASAHPSPTPTGAIASPGTFDSRKGFALEIIPNGNYTYYLHKKGQTVSTACAVTTLNATPTLNDIQCTLEANELDLWYNGITFYTNAPYSMCAYVRSYPYWYFAYPTGVPSATSLAKVTDNTVDPPTVTYYRNGIVKSAGAAGSNFNAAGSPSCATAYAPTGEGYDFSKDLYPGPNCCMGSYTYTESTKNPSATPSGSPITTVTSTQTLWGGDLKSCISGAATATQPLTVSGVPMPVITLVEGTGINIKYAPPAPALTTPLIKGGDTYLANYYDSTTLHYYSALPVPLQTISSIAVTPQPYYELQCLDAAKTTIARIRLQVRKWNLATELTKYVADPTTGDCHSTSASDPILGGTVDNFPAWDSPSINPNWTTPGATYPYE